MTIDLLETVNKNQILCLDDIDAWAGDMEKERALFALYERLKHAGGQLIASAIKAPDKSGFILPDLVSRLSSGLIYPLHHLDDAHMLSALKMRANYRGLSISEDAIKFLLTRLPRETALIFATLDHIDRASLSEQRKVTIPFLKQVLADKV